MQPKAMYSQQHKAPCPYIHTSLHLLLTYMQEGRGGDVQEHIRVHAHHTAACCSQAISGKGGKGGEGMQREGFDREGGEEGREGKKTKGQHGTRQPSVTQNV